MQSLFHNLRFLMTRWAVLSKPRGERKGGVNPNLLNVNTNAHAKDLASGR